MGNVTLEPNGGQVPWHNQEQEEIYFIVEGTGEMCLGEERTAVSTGQAVYIPPRRFPPADQHRRHAMRMIYCYGPAGDVAHWRQELDGTLPRAGVDAPPLPEGAQPAVHRRNRRTEHERKNVHTVGIIMNGVTGRMGLNQHLRRSIHAIMQQGGVRICRQRSRSCREPLLVGRNAAKLEAISREFGGLPWTTDLDEALGDPDYSDLLRCADHGPARRRRDARRSPPASTSTARSRSPIRWTSRCDLYRTAEKPPA